MDIIDKLFIFTKNTWEKQYLRINIKNHFGDFKSIINLEKYGKSMGKLEMKTKWISSNKKLKLSVLKKKHLLITKTFICDFLVGSDDNKFNSKNICIKILIEGHEKCN